VLVTEVPGSGVVTDIQLVCGWPREFAKLPPIR